MGLKTQIKKPGQVPGFLSLAQVAKKHIQIGSDIAIPGPRPRFANPK